MTTVLNNKIFLHVLVIAILPLSGCDNAANPFYARHPQKSQSFSDRRAIKDNNFIASGGLSKKHLDDPFVDQSAPQALTTSHTYDTANTIIQNKPAPKYKDPLPYDPSKANNKTVGKPVRRGQQSTIMDFLKSLGVSAKETSSNYYHSFVDEVKVGKDTVSNYITPDVQKRVPINNSVGNPATYAADEQGSSSIKYNHYETARKIGEPKNSISNLNGLESSIKKDKNFKKGFGSRIKNYIPRFFHFKMSENSLNNRRQLNKEL